MMALIGAFFFALFVLQDVRTHSELAGRDLPWVLIARYAVAMTIGGALVGFMLSGLFGRGGVGGWILACLGGLVAATLSGLFGSAFGLLPDLLADGYSTSDLVQAGAGALIVPLSLIEQPVFISVFAGLIVATHLWAKRARRANTDV